MGTLGKAQLHPNEDLRNLPALSRSPMQFKSHSHENISTYNATDQEFFDSDGNAINTLQNDDEFGGVSDGDENYMMQNSPNRKGGRNNFHSKRLQSSNFCDNIDASTGVTTQILGSGFRNASSPNQYASRMHLAGDIDDVTPVSTNQNAFCFTTDANVSNALLMQGITREEPFVDYKTSGGNNWQERQGDLRQQFQSQQLQLQQTSPPPLFSCVNKQSEGGVTLHSPPGIQHKRPLILPERHSNYSHHKTQVYAKNGYGDEFNYEDRRKSGNKFEINQTDIHCNNHHSNDFCPDTSIERINRTENNCVTENELRKLAHIEPPSAQVSEGIECNSDSANYGLNKHGPVNRYTTERSETSETTQGHFIKQGNCDDISGSSGPAQSANIEAQIKDKHLCDVTDTQDQARVFSDIGRNKDKAVENHCLETTHNADIVRNNEHLDLAVNNAHYNGSYSVVPHLHLQYSDAVNQQGNNISDIPYTARNIEHGYTTDPYSPSFIPNEGDASTVGDCPSQKQDCPPTTNPNFDAFLAEYKRRQVERQKQQQQIEQDNADLFLVHHTKSGTEHGHYSVKRQGNMADDETSGNDIDDILNQTLETIHEESDEEHDLAHLSRSSLISHKDTHLGTDDTAGNDISESIQGEPRSSSTSLNSTPASKTKFLQTTAAFLQRTSADKLDKENPFATELTKSVLLSDDDDYPEFSKQTSPLTKENVLQNVAQFDDEQTWYEENDFDLDRIGQGRQPIRIRWDQLADGLCRPSLVESEALSGSASTLCAEEDETEEAKIQEKTGIAENSFSTLSDKDEGKEFQAQDTCTSVWESEGTEENVEARNSGPSVSQESVTLEKFNTSLVSKDASFVDSVGEKSDLDLTASRTSEVSDRVSLGKRSANSTYSISSDTQNREPFCKLNKVSLQTDWEKVDLHSELTESVVMSDYVSDSAASVASDEDPYFRDMTSSQYGGDYQERFLTEGSVTLSARSDVTNDDVIDNVPSGFMDSQYTLETPTASMIKLDTLDDTERRRQFRNTRHEQYEPDNDSNMQPDTGYFSRSQDRESELDSSSSPTNVMDNSDEIRVINKDSDDTTKKIEHVDSFEELESKDTVSALPFASQSDPLLRQRNLDLKSGSGDKSSTNTTPATITAATGASAINRPTNKASFLFRRASSESMCDAHGDVESLNTAWYEEESPIPTPPVHVSNSNPFLSLSNLNGSVVMGDDKDLSEDSMTLKDVANELNEEYEHRDDISKVSNWALGSEEVARDNIDEPTNHSMGHVAKDKDGSHKTDISGYHDLSTSSVHDTKTVGSKNDATVSDKRDHKSNLSNQNGSASEWSAVGQNSVTALHTCEGQTQHTSQGLGSVSNKCSKDLSTPPHNLTKYTVNSRQEPSGNNKTISLQNQAKENEIVQTDSRPIESDNICTRRTSKNVTLENINTGHDEVKSENSSLKTNKVKSLVSKIQRYEETCGNSGLNKAPELNQEAWGSSIENNNRKQINSSSNKSPRSDEQYTFTIQRPEKPTKFRFKLSSEKIDTNSVCSNSTESVASDMKVSNMVCEDTIATCQVKYEAKNNSSYEHKSLGYHKDDSGINSKVSTWDKTEHNLTRNKDTTQRVKCSINETPVSFYTASPQGEKFNEPVLSKREKHIPPTMQSKHNPKAVKNNNSQQVMDNFNGDIPKQSALNESAGSIEQESHMQHRNISPATNLGLKPNNNLHLNSTMGSYPSASKDTNKCTENNKDNKGNVGIENLGSNGLKINPNNNISSPDEPCHHDKNTVYLTMLEYDRQMNSSHYGRVENNEANLCDGTNSKDHYESQSGSTQYTGSRNYANPSTLESKQGNVRDNEVLKYELIERAFSSKNNDSNRPRLPQKPSLPYSSSRTPAPDITDNILQNGSLRDRKQIDNTYENVLDTYNSRKVTAQATSTALARKDFKLPSGHYNSEVLADSVVSAVASAEATGDNPYIAVARATARAASIATASAAQSASGSENMNQNDDYDDNRDVTIMISTSCTIRNGEESVIHDSAREVVEALNSNANVAVYTRLVPNPRALLNSDQTQNFNTGRRLKVSIEQQPQMLQIEHNQVDQVQQDMNTSHNSKTVEVMIPENIDSSHLATMVTEAVNRILVGSEKEVVSQQQQQKHLVDNNHKRHHSIPANQLGKDRNLSKQFVTDVNGYNDQNDESFKEFEAVRKSNSRENERVNQRSISAGNIRAQNEQNDKNTNDLNSDFNRTRAVVANIERNQKRTEHVDKVIQDDKANDRVNANVPPSMHKNTDHLQANTYIKPYKTPLSYTTTQVRVNSKRQQTGFDYTLSATPNDIKHSTNIDKNTIPHDTSSYQTKVPHRKDNDLGTTRNNIRAANYQQGQDSYSIGNQCESINDPSARSKHTRSYPRSINQSPLSSHIVRSKPANSGELHDRNVDNKYAQKSSHSYSAQQTNSYDSENRYNPITTVSPINPKSLPEDSRNKHGLGYHTHANADANGSYIPVNSVGRGVGDITELKSRLNHPLEVPKQGNDYEKQWNTALKNNTHDTKRSVSPGYSNQQKHTPVAQIPDFSLSDNTVCRSRKEAAKSGSDGNLHRKPGSGTYMETDLDTGHSFQHSVLHGTHLDNENRLSNQNTHVRSQVNLNTSFTSEGTTMHTVKFRDKFEKTQSMLCLAGDDKSLKSNIDHVDNSKLSANNARVHNSLTKLHIPTWYKGNKDLDDSDQLLKNTRRSRDLSPCHMTSVTSSQGTPSPTGVSPVEGVPARIVSTKPVVIQHRVVTPLIRKSPQPQITQGADQFELPSTKWRQNHKNTFKPVPIRARHDLNASPRSHTEASLPAREAYLKLTNKGDTALSHGQKLIQNPAINNTDSPKYQDNMESLHANDSHRDQRYLVDLQRRSPDYVNVPVRAANSDDSEETPPPLPPRRGSTASPSRSQNGTHDFVTSSGHVGTRDTQDVHTSQHGSQHVSYTSQPDTHILHTSSQGTQNVNTPTQPPISHYQSQGMHIEGDNSLQEQEMNVLFRPDAPAKTVIRINEDKSQHPTNQHSLESSMSQSNDTAIAYQAAPQRPPKPSVTFNSVPTYLDQNPANAHFAQVSSSSHGEPAHHVHTNIKDEPVFERARQSDNKLISEFASDLDNDLEILRYDESPKRRRLPPSILDPAPDIHEVFPETSEGAAAVNKGGFRPMETSFNDSSQGNVSLDEIIDGLLTLPPSLDTSMTSQTNSLRRGYRKGVSSVSSSIQSLETPQERLFRLLRDASSIQNASENNGDLNVSKSNSMDISPREEYMNDSINQTAGASALNDSQILVKCRNTKCKREMNLKDARHTFKTCHNCFTYYCSRECRKAHWEKHKQKCVFSRVSSHCKHVIKKVHDSESLGDEFSKAARTGYIQKGRGCVVIAFSSIERANYFLENGFDRMQIPLAFLSIREIEESEFFADQLYELVEMCRTYNPEVKFVLNSVILSQPQQSQGPAPRKQGLAIKKCAKLRLTSAHVAQNVKQSRPSYDENDTLILTAVPGSEFTENMEEKKAREICFANIQRKLRQRGIRLRHQFPEVYNKLCAYVSDKEEFAPITLFPLDVNTGKRFMCLIMPNSEPEIEWLNKPDLLDELGLNTEV